MSEENDPLRPYLKEKWFLKMTKDQQVVFETRIEILCEDGPINREAQVIAWKEAVGAI